MLSLVEHEKSFKILGPDFVAKDQQWCRLACSSAESDKNLYQLPLIFTALLHIAR